jgi:hypothetical protein
MSKPRLKVAPCSFEAAKFANKHWHYSERLPAGKLVKFGVWEDDRFIGAVIYGDGVSWFSGKAFGVKKTEYAELVRVALDKHKTPVSRIVAISLRLLKRQNPGLRLLVSFADRSKGHAGGIYQAGNWIYTNDLVKTEGFILFGKLVHDRSVLAKYGTGSVKWIRENVDPNAKLAPDIVKHRYFYPLDEEIREVMEGHRKPYPKLEKGL